MVVCRLCGVVLKKDKWGRRRYCGTECRDKFHRLESCKEFFKLSPEDKLLREKVLLEVEKNE